MRLLVISDSHGRVGKVRDIIMTHNEADAVIFLGDGERDIDSVAESFPEKKFFCVCGNCDLYSQNPETRLEFFAGKRVYCTHGYLEKVKYGDDLLFETGVSKGADIILYGHTHRPVTDYRNGVYIMNPGTASMGEYGFVDITSAGIVCSLCKI